MYQLSGKQHQSILYFILNKEIFVIILISSNNYFSCMLLESIWKSATQLGALPVLLYINNLD